MYGTWETEDVILNMLKQKKELKLDFQFAEKEL